MVATVVLLGLVLVAAATDLLRHKIYNWTTYPGMLAALGLNAAGGAVVAATGATPEQLGSLGWIGLAQSLLGLLLCGFVMLACFVFLKVGGGDVKLVAMLGAFLGPQRGVEAMLWSIVLCFCTALVVLIWRVGPVPLLVAAFRHAVWTLRLGRFSPPTPQERAQLQAPLFLAPCALVAVVIVQFDLVARLGFG